MTGGSGWFGAVTLDLLLAELGAAQFTHRVRAYASTAKTIPLRDGTEVQARPLAELPGDDADVVLHYAYWTKDREAAGGESFTAANVAITLTVLEALERGRRTGFFYPSSGSVYARGGENLYGSLKRLDELAFRQACREAGASCIIARVFNVAGPYMTKAGLYALGDMIDQARSGGPVRIRAHNPVRRSYVSVADVVVLALSLLLRSGERRDEVFDTAGDDVLEMGDLAERVRTVVGGPEVAIEREEYDPGGPANDYLGDPARWRELAAEQEIPLDSFETMVRATAEHAG